MESIQVSDIRVSIVMPVFNGQSFIEASLLMVHQFLSSDLKGGIEIVVVNDGSTDRTDEIIRGLSFDGLKIITSPRNYGKYHAIRLGMSNATGNTRVFMDADVPFAMSSVLEMVTIIENEKIHVVIGDRNLPGSKTNVHRDLIRRGGTWVFSCLVGYLITPGYFDTQCGLKGFRGDVARAVFPLIRDDGFSGDVELLYLCLRFNLRIRRLPVRLERSAPTTVRPVRHAIEMLNRMVLIQLDWRAKRYSSDQLTELRNNDPVSSAD